MCDLENHKNTAPTLVFLQVDRNTCCWILFLANAINKKGLGIYLCRPQTPWARQRGFAAEHFISCSSECKN